MVNQQPEFLVWERQAFQRKLEGVLNQMGTLQKQMSDRLQEL